MLGHKNIKRLNKLLLRRNAMNFKIKNLSTLLLIFVLSLTMLCLSACAEETTDIIYELDGDGSGYWVTQGGRYVAETLEIPSEYEGLPILGIKDGAFKKSNELKSVVIAANDKGGNTFEIGAQAFAGCKALESVEILRSGMISVYGAAFSECASLKTVDMQNASEVLIKNFAFENTRDISVNISDSTVNIDSYAFSNNTEASTLNLTNCTGSVRCSVGNANYKSCTLENAEGSIKNLVLDDTALRDADMYLTVTNAIFRNYVFYHNKYESGFWSSNGYVITNLTIESIGENSSYSQTTGLDNYYPLAKNITIGSAVTSIPRGIFGNEPLEKLFGEDTKRLSITYPGASEALKSLPCDPLYNGNFTREKYDLISNDGKPATVTFVDENGNAVATMNGIVGETPDKSLFDLPNTKLVDGRIVEGYYTDSDFTNFWSIDSKVLGDTTVYLSFVDDELLKEAKLENLLSTIFIPDGDFKFNCEIGEDIQLTLDYVKSKFPASQFATVQYFGNEQCTKAPRSIFDEPGDYKLYARVTSFDRSVSNLYTIGISVKDIFHIIYSSDGMNYERESCLDGHSITFPIDPKKLGHTFIGWSVDGTENGIIESKYYYPTSDITLTAMFAKDVYTVTIAGTELSYSLSYGDRLALPLPDEKDYYKILGYEYDGKLVTTGLNENGCLISSYSFEKGIELSPMYEPIQYKLRLDNNTTYYTVEDEDITLYPAHRDWYKFIGWFTERNGQGTEYEVIDTSAPRDITLYSHFEYTSYTARFMDGDTVISEQQFTSLTTALMPPPLPQKSGYNSKWANYSIIPSDFDIQVVYTPIEYTITYENIFGCLNPNPSYYTVESGLWLEDAIRDHYVFEGWTDENGEAVTEIPTGAMGNIVLKAEWTVIKYAIYFYTDSTNYTYIEAEYNTVFNFDSAPIPTAYNKLFNGWYESQDYTDEINGKVTVGGPITVYAKWIDSTSILTAADFEKIRENPSGTFHLGSNIDMRGDIITPIADFTGILDGCGYKMYNFTLKINSTIGSFGLFNNNGGTIRNLTLDEVICSVETSPSHSEDVDNIGILVGLNNGIISNCYIISPSFTVTSQYAARNFKYYLNIGSLAGRNNGSITDCHVTVTFTSSINPINTWPYYSSDHIWFYSRIGGLVGRNNGEIYTSSADFSATAKGQASGNQYRNYAYNTFYIGGLVGTNDSNASVERCYAIGDIYTSSSASHGDVITYIGGFVGLNNGSVNESYSSGKIDTYSTATGSRICDVGGFAGYVDAYGSISNCYTTVSSYDKQATSVGGFAGYLLGSIQNCYSYGDIIIENSVSNVAGFVGAIGKNGIVNKSFTASEVTTPSGSAGFFCANDSSGTGIIQNSYYSASASLSVNGSRIDHAEEYGAKRDHISNITNSDFLQNKMYFYSDYWIFTTEAPVLKWEIATDGTDLFNGTYYICESCGNYYISGASSQGTTAYHDIAATCTTNGIRYFGCTECNKHFAVITESAKGHSFTDDSAGKDLDFCNDDVTLTYTCDDCKYSYTEQFIATGHRHEHTDACIGCGYLFIEGTCDKEGSLTFICDSCGETIVEATPAHLWEFASWYAEPTCDTNGIGTYICSRCLSNGTVTSENVEVQNSSLGHMDLNGDGLCDRENCGRVIYNAEEAIEISTVDQLLAIMKDAGLGSLSKTYILTADIDLKNVNWEPIGTKDAPFNGVFLGGGHKISNVPLFSSNKLISYCGLFGYNGEDGVISGLTIEYAHTSDYYELCQNRSITFGGIAAYNNGTINQCTVKGTVRMSFLTKAEVNTLGGSASASQSVILGLIAGENNGYIVGCNITANYTYAFENYAFMGEEISHVEPSLWTSGAYQGMKVTTKQTVIAGAICGKNNMSISNCTVSGTGSVYDYLAFSQFLKGKYGTLSATSDLNIGAIVGNQDLNGEHGNSVTGNITYTNDAGTYAPAAGNDPGNNYYSMSCSTVVTIFK